MRRSMMALALGLVAAPGAAMADPAPAATPATTPAVRVTPPPPVPLDPARVELGRQIIAVMFPPDQRDAIMHKLLVTLLGQFRQGVQMPKGFDDPGLKKIMDDSFASIPGRLEPLLHKHLPLIWEATAHAYAREFSTDELTQILAFAHTPAGQHYLERATALMGDPEVGAANAAYMGELQGYAQQIKIDTGTQIGAYLRAHPEVAARLQGNAAGKPRRGAARR